MSIAESEPLIGSEEIPQDDVGEGEDVQYILEGNFSERVAEHPLENIDIDRLLVERLGEFGWYQKVRQILCQFFLTCRPFSSSPDQLPAGVSAGGPDGWHYPGLRVHRVCPPPQMLHSRM